MTEAIRARDDTHPRTLLVTGPSGAGRSTAVDALEDLGFEAIDNLPLTLLPRLLDGRNERPLALGLDVRNRDFGTDSLIAAIDEMTVALGDGAQVMYLEADDDTLVRRYSETRRRHPLAPSETPLLGIMREKDLLAPIRARSDFLIDTSSMTPHELRDEMERLFAPSGGRLLALTVQSFSYKRGLPRGLDMVLDCRFLRNPHWDADLRALDGRDAAVVDFVEADTRFEPFFQKVKGLVDLILPASLEEGKSHLSIGFGCTGGKHRSVALTERLATALAEDGWQVSKRHRELERHEGVTSDGVTVRSGR